MENNFVLKVTCNNPECRQAFKVKAPQNPGIYSITCPQCKNAMKVRFPGVKPKEENAVDNSGKEPIRLQDSLVKDETSTIKCPHCNHEAKIIPTAIGEATVACKRCKGKFIVQVKSKTVKVSSGLVTRGVLRLLRRGWFDKEFQLHEGTNVLGRFDDEIKSNISIKGDDSMSRRSVDISVTRSEKGYRYTLTVLKAVNPVYHNERILGEGEKIDLNFGDSIQLGKTKFRFDKAKK